MMKRGMATFKELFDFSRRSSDSANFVREFTASLEPRAQISVSESENEFVITLSRPSVGLCTTRFKMTLENSEKAQKIRETSPEAIETILINNVEYGLFQVENEFRKYGVIVPEDLKKDGMVLLEYLKDIFSAELKNLEIAPGDSSLVSETSSEGLTVKEGKVTHGEMIKFLEDSSKNKSLACTPEPSEFTYSHPILADQLAIQNSQWFTRQNLLNLNCSRISLERSTLTSEDLNEFIKRWVNSDNKKFKQLFVSEALSLTRMLDPDVISSGLETITTCKKQMTDKYLLKLLGKTKPTTGFDIKRDDGLTATVTLGKSICGNEEFQFQVLKPKTKEGERDSLDSDYSGYPYGLQRCRKTHAEMRNLLEHGDSKEMNIWAEPEEGFVYDKPISTGSFTLHYSTWFTRQNLLNLDCAKIGLTDTKLTNEDINAFISQWYHSDNKKLRTFRICESETDQKVPFKPDLAVITAGIPTVPGKKRKRYLEKNAIYYKRKYEKGLDIIRSDGLEANVVLLLDDYEPGVQELIFTVFHPKEKKKAADKSSYQEDMLKALDEIELDDFEIC